MIADDDRHALEAKLNDALSRIERARGQAALQLRFWRRPDWGPLLAGIEDTVDEFVREAVDKVSPPERVKELTEIIVGRRGRLPLSSDITDQILGICKQILAFGAAGLALTTAFADKARSFSIPVQKILAVIAVFYTELVLVSLAVLACYMLQARFRYPFLYFAKVGNAWPYFYYSSISPGTPRRPLQTRKALLKGGALYAADLARFALRSVSEVPAARLRVELQQYFLLMAYQGYVNQFSLRLTNLFFYGMVGATASAVLLVSGFLLGVL